MSSLVDVARQMETAQQGAALTSAGSGERTAGRPLTLLDVAKEQQAATVSTTKANCLGEGTTKTLVDVAKQLTPSVVQPSLQTLAREIEHEDWQKVETSISVAASAVHDENVALRSAVLKESVQEVQKEEGQAVITLVEKCAMQEANQEAAEHRAVQPSPNAQEEGEAEEERYSSFDEDDKSKHDEPTIVRPKDKKKRKDDKKMTASAPAPSQTVASDSNEAKEFTRAVSNNDISRVEELLDTEGVDVTIADQHGWSGLHWAAAMGRSEILKLLIGRKSEVNAVEHLSGWSALHIAVVRNRSSCVRLLLSAGADPDIVDRYGDTVQDIAHALKGTKARLQMLGILEEHRNA